MSHPTDTKSILPFGDTRHAVPRFGTRLGGLLRMLARCHAKMQSRARLSDLSPHALRDIGLTPEDVRDELEKPFWR